MGIRLNGCCCMSLRTAGLLHGWVTIFLAAIIAVVTINQIIFHEYKEEFDTGRGIRVFTFPVTDRYFIKEYKALVLYFIEIIVALLLISGIQNNKHFRLLPWLILQFIGLAFFIPISLIIIFFLIVSETDNQAPEGIAILLIIDSLLLWSWMVIYSLYQEILETERRQQPMLPYPVTIQVPSHMPPAYSAQEPILAQAPTTNQLYYKH